MVKTVAEFHPITGSRGVAVTSPPWVEDAVVYEVFPRGYGKMGTLNEVAADLGRLHALGVSCLWLMPIHPIGVDRRKGSVGSPYAVLDHRQIDPALGGPDSLRALVERAHGRGLRVILDWVANHISPDAAPVQDHPDWLHLDARGEIHPPVPEWTDVVALDYRIPAVWGYMQEAMRYWITEFDVDGFRCDVAGTIPLEFWTETRELLRETKPDIALLAEAEGARYHRSAFDITYDWTLYDAMVDVHAGRDPASELVNAITAADRRYPEDSFRLRFVENHDKPRAAAAFGTETARAFLAFVLLSAGVPLLYAGQEAGVAERPDLFERTSIPFADGDPEITRAVTRLLDIRRAQPALRRGKTIPVSAAHARELAVFARRLSGAQVVVAVNVSGLTRSLRIDDPAFANRSGLELLTERPLHFGKDSIDIPPYGVLAVDTGV